MKKNKTAPKNYNLSSREDLSALSKEDLVDVVIQLGAKLQQLSDVVRDLVTAKYGRKTERFEDPDQLSLFAAEKAPVQDAHSTQSASKKKEKSSTGKGHSRNPFPEHLPRHQRYGEIRDEKKKRCPCGATLEVIRQILQRSRLQFVPASFFVEELITQVYCCPKCQGDEVVARVAETVPNTIAAPGLMAEVAVSKGTDHLPFNRQSAIYGRSGVNLSRSTLSDLFAQTAGILAPLYYFMHQQLLKSKVICTDDTPVKVQDRNKEKNIKLARLWIYLGDVEHPFNLFDYTVGRGRDGPLTFLENYVGNLQGDCFSGNLAVCAANGTILVACLAHARRYFIKALLNDKSGCDKALSMFQALYEIEGTTKDLGLTTPQIKSMRQEESVPILNKMHEWLLEQYKLALPQSSFGKALFYCLNNWTELKQYVSAGELSIDNNISEREMKHIAMGRRVWLFLGSDKAGANHAIVLSILSTCRRHGVEPWAYLTDLIERLTNGNYKGLEELLPHLWKQANSEQKLAEIKLNWGTQESFKQDRDPQNRCETLDLRAAI